MIMPEKEQSVSTVSKWVKEKEMFYSKAKCFDCKMVSWRDRTGQILSETVWSNVNDIASETKSFRRKRILSCKWLELRCRHTEILPLSSFLSLCARPIKNYLLCTDWKNGEKRCLVIGDQVSPDWLVWILTLYYQPTQKSLRTLQWQVERGLHFFLIKFTRFGCYIVIDLEA